jgi:endonuclease YncB( thermonuclease family)
MDQTKLKMFTRCKFFAEHQNVSREGAGTLEMTLRSFMFAPFLIGAACLCASTAFADNLTGQASIIDGDTLEIHGTHIRLWGIDAPESSRPCRDDKSLQYQCGAKAANQLDTFIARRPVDCSPVSLDQYGRTLAVCSIGGVDLAEWLVRNGLALDWPLYSKREVRKGAERG